MKISNHAHLAYCTNVHRGNSWAETFDSLERYVMKVRNSVAADKRGLPSAYAWERKQQVELSDAEEITTFRRWLDRNNAYVFTINGFPYGNFHGSRVKEQVYRPDWTSSPKTGLHTPPIYHPGRTPGTRRRRKR